MASIKKLYEFSKLNCCLIIWSESLPRGSKRGLKTPIAVYKPTRCLARCVAPHAGAWIETRRFRSRRDCWTVAPHAGAWIETGIVQSRWGVGSVAPHAGAWIETSFDIFWRCIDQSLPTRERGLKHNRQFISRLRFSRSPRGSVD